MRSKFKVLIERSTHVKYKNPISNHSQDITFLKFLQADREMDGQAKNYMPLIFRYGGMAYIDKE
jgi:hypothetical protein